MSRHNIALTPPGRTLVVGWDVPLQTFFAQLYEGEDMLFWLGGSPGGRIDSIEELQRELSTREVPLLPSMISRLYDDQDEGR